MGAAPVAKLSVEEYLALDRAAEVKSEYHDGELFPLQAVTWAHARINFRFAVLLDRKLAKTGCQVLPSSLRVQVRPAKFLIPDLLVVCGKLEFTDEHNDTITNPKVIVEVLSPSTADYDYGGKFNLYRRLSSLEEYVLISQDQALVETFRKTLHNEWVLHTDEGLDATLTIKCLGISVPLREVYEGVALSAASE
jgi:Uma2 family endonuclease